MPRYRAICPDKFHNCLRNAPIIRGVSFYPDAPINAPIIAPMPLIAPICPATGGRGNNPLVFDS